jgi:hypothetical protein
MEFKGPRPLTFFLQMSGNEDKDKSKIIGLNKVYLGSMCSAVLIG